MVIEQKKAPCLRSKRPEPLKPFKAVCMSIQEMADLARYHIEAENYMNDSDACIGEQP